MNKILIDQGSIKQKQIDESIELSLEEENHFLDVKILKIIIKKDTDLEIKWIAKEKVKLDIYIDIKEDVKCNIAEIKEDGKYKIRYKYNLEKDSNLNIIKINNVKKIKESIIFNLNGNNAKLNYLFKTISKDKEKYDLMVYHNHKNTSSNIINHGVNIKDGSLKFNVSGFVPKGKINCLVDQKNRIINLTDEKCEIMPNLFIDENDVIANHSAHIGKCKDEELFYLESRGIKEKEAEMLLIKGFLLQKLTTKKEEMENIIKKYWRWYWWIEKILLF